MIEDNKLSKKQLMETYKWTDKMVKKYLPNPQKKYNMNYPTPSYLYNIADVEAVMQTEEFKAEFAELTKRRERQNNPALRQAEQEKQQAEKEKKKEESKEKRKKKVKNDFIMKVTGFDTLTDEALAYYDKIYEQFSEKERTVADMRMQGKTLQDCGDVLGMTKENIRQIELRIRKKYSAVE